MGEICQDLVSEIPKMKDLAKKAAQSGVEYGAVITSDWKLGNEVKGSERQITIPHVGDSKGTFHTHRIESHPSTVDLWEMTAHQEEVMCIGTARMALPELQCFYPQKREDFHALGQAVHLLEDRKRDYLQKLEGRYGKAEARTPEEKAEGLAQLRSVQQVKEIIEKRWPEVISACALK